MAGLIADAIIMLGGVLTELRSGGIEVAGGGGIGDAIVEEEEEGASPTVNGGEVRRFLRLAKGSLEEIDRIASTLFEEEEA